MNELNDTVVELWEHSLKNLELDLTLSFWDIRVAMGTHGTPTALNVIGMRLGLPGLQDSLAARRPAVCPSTQGCWNRFQTWSRNRQGSEMHQAS